LEKSLKLSTKQKKMSASDKRTVKMSDASIKPRKLKKHLRAADVKPRGMMTKSLLLHLCVYLVCITQTLQLQQRQQQQQQQHRQQQHGQPEGNMLQQHHRTSVNSSVNINISRQFNEIIQTATASASASGTGSASGAVTFASVTAATTITPGRRKLRRKFQGQQNRNSTLGRRRKLRLHPYHRRNATHATRTTTVASVSATATTLLPKMPHKQPFNYHTHLHSSFQQQQQQQHVAGGQVTQQQQQQQQVHVVAVTPRPQQRQQQPGFAIVPATYYHQQQQQQRTLLGNLTQQQQQQQQHLLIQPGQNILVYSNLGPIPPCPPGLLSGSGMPVYTQQQHFIPLRSTTTPRPRQRGKQILSSVAINSLAI